FVQGVTAAATGAIAGAGFVLAKHSIHDAWTAAIAIATFLVLMNWKVPEPVVILLSGMLGLAVHLPYKNAPVLLWPCSSGLAVSRASWFRSPRTRKNTALASASSTSPARNVKTMVALVGKSSRQEIQQPSAETSVPMVQPMAKRVPMRSANSMAPTEGTMR